LVEEGLDGADGYQAEHDACGCAHENHREDVGGDAAGDVRGSRADSHANADFAAALLDRIVKDSVEADRREEKGER